jgi:calcineurin-like phosphoesterase
MRLLFLGDVVVRTAGKSWSTAAQAAQRYKLDFVVVNGENSAGGFGITEAIFEDLLAPAPTW